MASPAVNVTTGIAVAFGLVIGLVAGVVMLRRSAAVRAEGLFRCWQAEDAGELTRDSVDASRLGVKASVGARLASGAALPFLAADAHFVGHPVHLVIFDGDSEIKAGVIDDLRSVVLVTVAPQAGGSHGAENLAMADAELVAECVASGRVRWQTLRHPGASV
ncbi:MAG: hypothetical protein M3063_02195 [Actinomycetota bacterium]|nr:hypothetical protein [Actinomycetota bacterium]